MSDNDGDDGTVKFPEKKDKPLNTVFLPVKPLIDYGAMITDAYVGIIRDALSIISDDPEPGKYCVDITFDVGHPDVEVPQWVYDQYSHLLTIILNERYDYLTVHDDYFEVTVYFGGQPAHLLIPFDAITIFKDSHQEFAVGLGDARVKEATKDEETITETLEEIAAEDDSADIVSLDAFRKKKDD